MFFKLFIYLTLCCFYAKFFLFTTVFHVHYLSITRRVSSTFIHRSRLWAWRHHPSSHQIAANTSFSRLNSRFCQSLMYGRAITTRTQYGVLMMALLTCFLSPYSEIDFFFALITSPPFFLLFCFYLLVPFNSVTPQWAPVTPPLEDWLFVPPCYTSNCFFTSSSLFLLASLHCSPFSICPQFVSVCSGSRQKA